MFHHMYMAYAMDAMDKLALNKIHFEIDYVLYRFLTHAKRRKVRFYNKILHFWFHILVINN